MWSALHVEALYDGDRIGPYETVMTIEGDYAQFAHLETCYLGVLSRRTRIASNAQKIVSAANGVSTDANAEWWGALGMGTVPHALIAAYDGDTVLATEKFARYIEPNVNVISLVEFDNDCAGTSLAVARALGDRLWGVRLDTSGALVDRSLWPRMGTFNPTGVNAQLVRNVRNALDDAGFTHVRIVVSGGFDATKITAFERERVPADAYAVGSAFFAHTGAFDFTADIVAVRRSGSWYYCHKVGRPARPNPRLQAVRV